MSNSIVLDNSFDSYLSKGERIGVEFNGAETIVGYELKPCAICLEDLGSTRIVKLRCDHFYHKACVEPWSQNADTCPTCRESFRWSTQILFDLRLCIGCKLLIDMNMSGIISWVWGDEKFVEYVMTAEVCLKLIHISLLHNSQILIII